MAGIPEQKLLKEGRFPDGVNNVVKETDFPRDENGHIRAARELVNVDLDGAGHPQMKRGHVVLDPATSHSLHCTETETNQAGHLLSVVGGDLKAFDDPGDGLVEVATLIEGLGERFLTYASDDFDTWWSNGLSNGRIDVDLQLHPFWLDTPAPVQLATSSNGGLAAGTYEISVTVVDADGRESGASNPSVVTVTAGQGIVVTLPAAPAGAARWRIYRSTQDGDVLYLVEQLPIGTITALLGHAITRQALKTAWLFPMPPCDVLRYGHGRMLGIGSNNVLMWSEAYALGLMHDQNHMLLGAKGTLLEPVGQGGDGAGWFVADHKRTYFLAGADPKEWRQVIRYPHAAVPGTSLTLPGTVFGLDIEAPVAFWVASNGTFCLGLPGGIVKPLRENELAMPRDSERGAAAFFEFEGIRQIVTSILAGAQNPLGVTDSAVAEIRRHGVSL